MGLGIEIRNDRAGGFLEQARDKRMDQSRPGRRKQLSREFGRERHMLQKRLVYFGGMVEEDAVDHGSGSYLAISARISKSWCMFIPKWTKAGLISGDPPNTLEA